MFSVPAATRRAGLLVLALGCSTLAADGQAAKNAAAALETVYVNAGHLFDATSDKLGENVVLVVEGDVSIPAGATVVDLSKDWVLPGLIDCHTHLEARADHYDPIWDVKETRFDGGFNGVVNANRTLMAGFTSVRDVGSQLIDHAKDVGTLEAGKYGDLIAVAENPLDRVEVLERASFVMKGGKVYKDELGAAAKR